jgi:hypothetical protein
VSRRKTENRNTADGRPPFRVYRRHGEDYEKKFTGKWIGGVIRRELRIRIESRGGVFVILETVATRIGQLFEWYGVEAAGEEHFFRYPESKSSALLATLSGSTSRRPAGTLGEESPEGSRGRAWWVTNLGHKPSTLFLKALKSWRAATTRFFTRFR